MNYKVFLRFAAQWLMLILFVCLALLPGCGVYDYDGAGSAGVTSRNGFFYLLERSTVSLIMLDSEMREVKRWPLQKLLNETSLQGITFDGDALWISSAGSADKIYKLDVSGDSLIILKQFTAPPAGQGTVRDIAWAEGSLWALNSGSSTSGTPASLYKLNPTDGAVQATYAVPSSEPRGLTFMPPTYDVYGSGLDGGLYYTDVTSDKVYHFRTDRPFFDTLFTTPAPPRGTFARYPAGITFDGARIWVVNSSDVADHLYALNFLGAEKGRVDLPYAEPGPAVWANVDVRTGVAPTIAALLPNNGGTGSTLDVEIYGTGFKTSSMVNFGADITVNNLTLVLPTLLRANITIGAAAAAGKRAVTVTNPGNLQARADSAFTVSAITTLPYLWVADQATGQRNLYKIRLTDTTVVKEWPTADITADGIQGIATDGNSIWAVASGTTRTLYKLNTSGASLAITSSFPVVVAGGTLRGMVYDNGFIWQSVSASGTTGKIYKINAATGAVADSITTPGIEVRGVAVANGKLYCNDTSLDSVFVYNQSTGTWSGVFATPTPAGGTTTNRFATGLVFDGSTFWIANSTGDFDQLYNVSLTGTVLRVFDAPRKGVAQITGITYTRE